MVEDLRAQQKAQLRQAYTLIKAGNKAEALELIQPILAQQPDNIDAWWLAAHSAPTPRTSAFACQKILTLKPDHWPAQQMLSEQQRLIALAEMLNDPGVDPSQPTALKTARQPRKPLRAWQVMIPFALVILLIGGYLVFASITGNTLGLPIGPLFNTTAEVQGLSVSRLTIDNPVPKAVNIGGTLMNGSQHDYRIRGVAGATLRVSIIFGQTTRLAPGDAVSLIDEKGKVVAVFPKGADALQGLTYTFERPTMYTLRLVGTPGKAVGPYVINLTLFVMDPSFALAGSGG